MGKPRDLVSPTSPSRAATVTPLYVCPGVHDEPLPYAMFPIGDGVTELRNCPLRDCCLWYAGHDLGGADDVADFPPDAVLAARFRTPPFDCSDYQEADASILTFRPKDDANTAKPAADTLIVAEFTPASARGGQSAGR